MTDADAHAQRVYLAGEALNAYCNARGTLNAPDEDITDLITDLLHLLDTYEGQASVSLVLDMVKSHYEEETDA
jgi:hypothetical protein